MDRFVSEGNSGALPTGWYDARLLPLGHLAEQYTLLAVARRVQFRRQLTGAGLGDHRGKAGPRLGQRSVLVSCRAIDIAWDLTIVPIARRRSAGRLEHQDRASARGGLVLDTSWHDENVALL
jgi:hypothetical protein